MSNNNPNPLTLIKLRNPIHFLAVGFGSGLLKPAPGTWGTLVGWLIGIGIMQYLDRWYLIACAILAFAVGSYICGKTAEDMGVHDHSAIVWDEIAAIWVVLVFVPALSLFWCVIAFVLFRFFDIIKPYPIKLFDQKLKSGFGIMIDDTLAAVFSIVTLRIVHLFT